MSPYCLRVPAHTVNLKYVGTGAICAMVNTSNITEGEEAVKATDEVVPRQNTLGVDVSRVSLAVPGTTCPCPKNPVAAAFILHLNSILETMPPCPLKDKLSKFMERDWHDIDRRLGSGEREYNGTIKAHWRHIELLVQDTNDMFLQEGALLLSLVMGEGDLASEFYASVEGMEFCIKDGLGEESLPIREKIILRVFEDGLLQCRNEVFKILKSGMKGNSRIRALKTQGQKLRALIKAFEDLIPQDRFKDDFKRQGYKCLISIQECQLRPLKTPEIAAFSRSLRAVAGNVSDPDFADKVFQIIHTTLEPADASPTPEAAALFAAQWSELFFQHEHLLSPVVLGILKAQGEAVLKRVFESASRSRASESHGWRAHLGGLISKLIKS